MEAIHLRDYDFEAARARVHARVDRERGLVFENGQPVGHLTDTIRGSLQLFSDTGERMAPISWLRWDLVYALAYLPVEMGGTVQAVPGGYAALPSNLHPELPLVRALMIARAHPTHGPFAKVPFERPEQPTSVPASDIGPLLERMYAADPVAWNETALQRTILDGAKSVFGDLGICPTSDPDDIWLGSFPHTHLKPLATAFILEAAGVLEPGFTRQDALAGEWWLLQPTSPRIDFYALARRLDSFCMGVMPAAHVDVPGRMVMMCYADQGMNEQRRIAEIEDSKWVSGWKKVIWGRRQGPLADPTFDVMEVLPIVEDDPSPAYRHSSELPPWP